MKKRSNPPPPPVDQKPPPPPGPPLKGARPMDFYEALAVADILSDHVTEPRELEGAMGRLKRAWPEFTWTYSQQDDGHGGRRRAITIDTRNLPSGEAQTMAEATERLEGHLRKAPADLKSYNELLLESGQLTEKASDEDGPGYVGGPAGPWEG